MKPKTVKFRRGFKKNSKKDIIQLLQKTICKSRIKTDTFVKLVDKFKLIPEPNDELDWLAQFNERAQACDQFVEDAPFYSPEDLGSKLFIYYVQIGELTNSKLDFNHLIEYSKNFFSEKTVKFMPFKIDILKQANSIKSLEIRAKYQDKSKKLKHRYDCETGRLQIVTQSLFSLLKEIKPKDAHCLIGFTEFDFYSESSDLFVAGLCDGALRVGAFSCFRYDPALRYSEEFWYKTRKSNAKKEDSTLLVTRSCKLLVHETCHLLGFDHCVFMDCCMNGSGHLKEDFRQSMFLCPIDLRKLSYLIEFDPIERYEKLKGFFSRIQSNDEVEWLSKTILSLKNV